MKENSNQASNSSDIREGLVEEHPYSSTPESIETEGEESPFKEDFNKNKEEHYEDILRRNARRR